QPRRARERPLPSHRAVDLRLPQRHAARGHHPRHDLLLHAGGQRARGEGLRLARHRLLRPGGAARLRLRAGPGVHPDHGHAVRPAQPGDRRPLRPHRPAREDRGVTAAALRHARHVGTENPITLIAFLMLLVLLLLAVLGPSLAPYDPLKSDTASTLKPPSARHWFGTDQLGRDMMSRVMVAARLDMAIAFSAVTLSFLAGSLAGAC